MSQLHQTHAVQEIERCHDHVTICFVIAVALLNAVVSPVVEAFTLNRRHKL